jgi:hypothetical protein
MSRFRSPFFYFILSLLLVFLLAAAGPEERALGASVRIVYLHGAWVLTAQIALAAGGLAGLLALLLRRDRLHAWSRALGWTGMLFWVTYLPLSLWAMQANWNGLFLSEPRFRLAFVFAVSGVLLQAGLWLFDRPWLTSAANAVFIVVLRAAFAGADYVMHPPPSPIFSSGLADVQVFFLALTGLTLAAAWFLTRSLLGSRALPVDAAHGRA